MFYRIQWQDTCMTNWEAWMRWWPILMCIVCLEHMNKTTKFSFITSNIPFQSGPHEYEGSIPWK